MANVVISDDVRRSGQYGIVDDGDIIGLDICIFNSILSLEFGSNL